MCMNVVTHIFNFPGTSHVVLQQPQNGKHNGVVEGVVEIPSHYTHFALLVSYAF